MKKHKYDNPFYDFLKNKLFINVVTMDEAKKIYAPFTPEQVLKLMAWQEGNIFFTQEIGGVLYNIPAHPFTCCSYNGCDRLKQINEGELIPREEGWICPCGRYKQDWAHDFMVE